METKKRYVPLLVLAGVAAVAVALRLFPASALSLLVLLACPAMMFFMMRGMHHGAAEHGHKGCSEREEHCGDADVTPR